MYNGTVDIILIDAMFRWGFVTLLIDAMFRWGFVTHAAIYGYCKKIIYLHCSTNSKACTVQGAFVRLWKSLGSPIAYELIMEYTMWQGTRCTILQEEQSEEALCQTRVSITR